MATSSIIENIRVNNPNALEEFASHLEEAAAVYHKRTEAEKSGVITEESETQAFMRKALERKGIHL